MNTVTVPVSTAKTAYDLLSDVRKTIEAEPKRILMDIWGGRVGNANTALSSIFGDDRSEVGPACGTVGCIGGWMECLTRQIKGDAFTILGATGTDTPYGKAIQKLFYSWAVKPAEYGTKAYASAVSRRIKAFQKKWATTLKAQKLA